jgi:hypothetical protein
MNKELNEKERSYLQDLFYSHHEKMNKQLDEELSILSKYKLELARNYETVGKYNQTLIGCMHDILNKQEQLIGFCLQLDQFISRIERYFLKENE